MPNRCKKIASRFARRSALARFARGLQCSGKQRPAFCEAICCHCGWRCCPKCWRCCSRRRVYCAWLKEPLVAVAGFDVLDIGCPGEVGHRQVVFYVLDPTFMCNRSIPTGMPSSVSYLLSSQFSQSQSAVISMTWASVRARQESMGLLLLIVNSSSIFSQ